MTMKAMRYAAGVVVILALLLAAVICCAVLYAIFNPGASVKPSYKDVPYASLSPAQKLDIYLPENSRGPYPVVIWIHGGGWSGGDKAGDGTGGLVSLLLDRGYAVVSINYRLSSEAKFPAQIYDVKAAIRWVRAHSKKYHMDPHYIAVWGGSAGGHLAALAGTSGDISGLEDLSMGNANESSRVQAVIDWFGPNDFNRLEEQARESDIILSPATMPCVTGLIGGNLSDRQDLVKAANPETYISADDPPFFIEHGMKDELVPVQQSVELSEKLKTAIGPDNVTLLVFEGAGHCDSQFLQQALTSENLTLMYAFLDKNLKK
jgi:acetyl esterase/lipase